MEDCSKCQISTRVQWTTVQSIEQKTWPCNISNVISKIVNKAFSSCVSLYNKTGERFPYQGKSTSRSHISLFFVCIIYKNSRNLTITVRSEQ